MRLELGIKRTDDQGIGTIVDPWWSVYLDTPNSRTSIQSYILKLGPLEVWWIPWWHRYGMLRVKFVGTRTSGYMMGGCF